MKRIGKVVPFASQAALAALSLALLVGAPSQSAQAQPAPEFKVPEKEKEATAGVKWKAEAQAGLIITTGNSQTTTLSAGGKASRKEGFNKFEVAGSLAFARSSILLANDVNGDGAIGGQDEILRETQTTAESYQATARYDRFLSEKDSLWGLGKIGADIPAGKDLIGGGQLGYARLLLSGDIHELKSEAGYDFTYEKLASGDSSSIHSARIFLGYAGKLSEDTAVGADLEGLFNLNSVDNGRLDEAGMPDEAGTFQDTRVNGNLSLTTKLFSNISFRFGFGFKWDNFAAPAPALSVPYAAGFVPIADELDTKTEASLIINFL